MKLWLSIKQSGVEVDSSTENNSSLIGIAIRPKATYASIFDISLSSCTDLFCAIHM